MTQFVTRFPAGFDYTFRPQSYFSGLDPSTVIVASILGEERRRDVAARLKSGDFDPAVWGEWLTDSKLDDDIRKLTGMAHPRFMGGEYLPALAENEIEIARIVLASVTQDVISVRARKGRTRIHYSVHDEYESKFDLSRKTSKHPLSLRDLIGLIDESEYPDAVTDGGLAWSRIRWHVDDGLIDDLRNFVRVESEFYPEVGNYYEALIGDFFDEVESRQNGEELDNEEVGESGEFSAEEPFTGKSGGSR